MLQAPRLAELGSRGQTPSHAEERLQAAVSGVRDHVAAALEESDVAELQRCLALAQTPEFLPPSQPAPKDHD